jgi:uncharacterized repeat protein (TIGR01451 family)
MSWLLCAGASHAAGTLAGTSIPNIAVINYTYNGQSYSQQAAAPFVTVARLLAPGITWQDSTPTPSNSPDQLRALTFAVTNLGNAADTFVLTRDNTVSGDQFDPSNAAQGAVWLESGGQPGLQVSGPNADVPYVPGSNDPVVAAGASRTAYLASSIPSGLPTGATGRVNLQARSTLAPPNAAPGAQVAVVNGIPVIAGPNGARSVATGTYLVSVVAIGIGKSVVSAVDDQGGNRVMPGTVITYRLLVSATGTGAATNVVVSDALPASLSFVPGSITVDGVSRTDAADADDSSFSNGTVRTVLPSLAAPQSRAIEFKTTVN